MRVADALSWHILRLEDYAFNHFSIYCILCGNYAYVAVSGGFYSEEGILLFSTKGGTGGY